MDIDGLQSTLEQLEGRGYKAYRQIAGAYEFPRFTLFVDHVQGDPFAALSRLRARVPLQSAGFDPQLFSTRVRRIAFEDFLARAFDRGIGCHVKGHRGTGKSGLVSVDSGGQEILERSAAVVTEEFVEVRFAVGLPAAGRRCLGREAFAMLGGEVPRVVDASMFEAALDKDVVATHVETAEDQEWLRSRLGQLGLVAFVADSSVLPRESGVTDMPFVSGPVVSFHSPEDLSIEIELPNRGRTRGMGIPEGVTLIVGGGFHGKSTLLSALERGVYNNIPGDGREGVVTREDAVKIRAEDGRRVEKVNISAFISNLPFGIDTTVFSTENASGSTSQAANIVEALEMGSGLLLMDEDTSATNFMVRDELMQRLVPADREPITPFIDQVHNLYREFGVSTILVMGGSGDYFEVADHVIAMYEYQPTVVTAAAREIARHRKGKRKKEGGESFGQLTARAPGPDGIDPRRGRKEKVAARGLGTILFGCQTVDLSSVEQLVDISQTRATGDIVRYARRRGYIDGHTSMRELLELIMGDLVSEGLDIISPYRGDTPGHPGDYAMPRPYEVAAMLNRMRSLRVVQVGSSYDA